MEILDESIIKPNIVAVIFNIHITLVSFCFSNFRFYFNFCRKNQNVQTKI